MSEHFSSLVALCRRASQRSFEHGTLTLRVDASQPVVDLVKTIEPWRDPEIHVDGTPRFEGIAAIASGTTVELSYQLGGNDRVLATDIGTLLAFQGGFFQSAPPKEYYLLNEDYASGEATHSDTVAGYLRIPALLALLRSLADAVLHTNGVEELVFLATKRIVVPIHYDSNILPSVPDEFAVRALDLVLTSAPHEKDKRVLLKAALQRLTENVSEPARLEHLIKNFSAWRSNFEADFELFSTEFNFEKTREEFERKRTEYLLKCNGVVTDILTKLLAIPVGQGLLASQMKTTAESGMANLALLAGGAVFFIIGIFILVHHVDSLSQILREFEAECEGVRTAFPETYKRLEGTMEAVRKRIARSRRWIPPV
jgi:hypothetical protein